MVKVGWMFMDLWWNMLQQRILKMCGNFAVPHQLINCNQNFVKLKPWMTFKLANKMGKKITHKEIEENKLRQYLENGSRPLNFCFQKRKRSYYNKKFARGWYICNLLQFFIFCSIFWYFLCICLYYFKVHMFTAAYNSDCSSTDGSDKNSVYYSGINM